RTFTWNLKAPTAQAFQIDFTKMGLRQINPSESCPDKHTFTLEARGNVSIGKYCKKGTIISAQVLNQGRFSLHVPAKQKLQNAKFDVSTGEKIKCEFSCVSVRLFFLTSVDIQYQYGNEWDFQVPAKHKTYVQFSNHMLPQCRKKPALEYQSKRNVNFSLSMTDTKPVQTEGNFSLILRNCEMDRRHKNSPGLNLNFKVSAAKMNSPGWFLMDVMIQKKRPGSECELKMKSVTQEKITVPPGSTTQVSLQDCLPEDLHITARTVIECYQLKDCPKAPVLLTVPVLPDCLPAPLSNVTWTLRSPPHGTVELRSPNGTLRQSLPGQPCNDSIVVKLAEDDGTCLGHFCSQGAIKKVQIHTNMTVTAYSTGNKAQMSPKPVLSAFFREEISGNKEYIFTVSPKKGIPVHVATPGWPGGMKPHSTVSWIVSVPSGMGAHLMFANLSQPKCSKGHASIWVQSLGSQEEMYSRREDEEADSEITVYKSFYLNMSNCLPEKDSFSVVTQITLHKNKNLLLTVILSVVAALLAIFSIVLAVVCVVIRKKKKKLHHQVSIYNPNGTSSWPEPNGIPKSLDDDSHVYATIEDTLVYTHLLRKGEEMGIYGEHDTYQEFTGPPSHHAPPLPNRPPSQGQHMVDNELYHNELYHTERQSEEGHFPDVTGSRELGPRLDPEGGN
uniref:CUB domain containing protein 1a n=1 Tax=Myripristis murdjan TaxID=586833 RepID=A0A667YGX4_9TELE